MRGRRAIPTWLVDSRCRRGCSRRCICVGRPCRRWFWLGLLRGVRLEFVEFGFVLEHDGRLILLARHDGGADGGVQQAG